MKVKHAKYPVYTNHKTTIFLPIRSSKVTVSELWANFECAECPQIGLISSHVWESSVPVKVGSLYVCRYQHAWYSFYMCIDKQIFSCSRYYKLAYYNLAFILILILHSVIALHATFWDWTLRLNVLYAPISDYSYSNTAMRFSTTTINNNFCILNHCICSCTWGIFSAKGLLEQQKSPPPHAHTTCKCSSYGWHSSCSFGKITFPVCFSRHFARPPSLFVDHFKRIFKHTCRYFFVLTTLFFNGAWPSTISFNNSL